MERTVARVMLQQLQEWKVKNIYGYAGDTVLSVFAELADSPIKLFTTKHESTAGMMASAEAKLTGQFGVCIVHSGPGTANVINGIADAYSDRVPLLLISGQVPSWNLSTNYKQYIDQIALTKPLTVFSAQLTNPDAIVDLLIKAMVTAITRGGVSHLVVPMDLWDKNCNAVPRPFLNHLNSKQQPDSVLIGKAARLIETASRPVILFGRGARNSLQELNRLADLRGCALINTLPARGTFTTKDPLYVGGLGHGGSQAAEKVLAEADLVLTFGATWWPMGYVPREPRIIQFDAAKENIGMSHPIELGIVGDIKMSLNMLLEQLVERHDENWLKTVHQAKQAWVAGLNEEVSSQDIPLYPQQAIATISRYTAANETICLDSGDNVIWFSRFFDATCRDILVSGTWRTMGYALPAALAAKINNQEEPVTCLTGDGGFAMTMPEVLTAVRYNLPVRIIILNNSTLAMEKNRMTVTQMTPYEMDQTNPDFIKYAEACNIDAFRVQGPESLTGVLQETSYLTNTTLIEVPVKNIVSSGTRLEREPASKMV